MATTQDYLTQLQIDKENLVANLVARGVDAANDETFTTLVPNLGVVKKDDGAVDDFISSNGKVEMIARCKDQDITFVLDISELLKCLKFLEN